MNDSFHVLLVNFANWMGLARLPGVLHRAGCRVSLLAPDGNYSAKSRFVDELFPAPNSMPAMIESLKENLAARKRPYDWVILGDDELLLALAKHRNEPWLAGCFPVDPLGGGLDFLTSKAVFTEAAQKEGLPVPDSQSCGNLEEAFQASARIGYPLILKKTFGFGGDGVGLVHDPEELRRFFTDNEKNGPILLQGFAPGRAGMAICLFDHGELAGWIACYKSKTHPGAFGPSSAQKFVHLPQLQPILRKLGGIHNFHGFAGVDFMHDPSSGSIVLLEMNGRPTPQVYLGRRVGADFSRAIHAMLSGQRRGSCVTQRVTAECYIPLFPQDLIRSLEEGDLSGLLRWIFWLPWWRDAMWEDPALLKIHFRMVCWKAKNILLRKLNLGPR